MVINILVFLSQEIKIKYTKEEKMRHLAMPAQCPFVWNWDDVLLPCLTNNREDFALQRTVQREIIRIWCPPAHHFLVAMKGLSLSHTHTLLTPHTHTPSKAFTLSDLQAWLWGQQENLCQSLQPMTHTAQGPQVFERIPLSTHGCRPQLMSNIV